MENKIELITLISIVVLSMLLGYLTVPAYESLESKIRYNTNNYTNECNNLSLEDTAHCLNSYVRNIYSYNVTDDDINLTLEELKEKGGDCKNWAELYYDMALDLGFNVEMPIISTRKGYAHAFTIISDGTGYCLLDQRHVNCWEIKGEKDETK